MAEIFISYARADRPRAEQLARALERTGWSVWWDREIPPGRSFDEVIEEALSLARCVIVLWSEASVRSEWVKTEASEAAQRRILVPILADGAKIPLEFRRIQAATIDDWRDVESSAGWAQLCDAVGAHLGSVRAAPPRGDVRSVRRASPQWVIAGGVALAVVTVAAAMLLRQPAETVASPPVPSTAATVASAPSAPLAPLPVPPAQAVTASAPPEERTPPPAPVTRPRPRRPPTEAASTDPAPSRTAPVEARPQPLDAPLATKELAAKLDREPRLEATAASFDVTLLYGVFRDQVGRLSVSPTGVRFHETGGGGRTFELTCGALRRVATATMIADREQRLLELTSEGQAYRVRATDTGVRDTIRAAIGRSCGR